MSMGKVSTLDIPVTAEMRDDRVLRLGMVGGGLGAFIGGVHRAAARLDNRYELVAGVFSEIHEEAVASARLLRVPTERTYLDYNEMAEREAERADRIDAVVIVTPNYLHYPIAEAFARRGFNIICDKPLCTTLEEARKLAAIAREAGVVFCVTQNYTGYPMVREARALVASGVLGKLRTVKVSYAQEWLTTSLETSGHRQAKWRGDPALGGMAGCVADIGSHAFNLAQFISGLDVESLCAELCTFVEGRLVDDHAQVMIRYNGGARGSIWASQVAPGEEQNLEISIYGERGGLVWRHETADRLILSIYGERPQILSRGSAGRSEAAARSTRLPAGLPEGYFECFANLYSDVAEAITARLQGKSDVVPKFPTVDDGVKVIEFIDASIRSNRDGGVWTTLRSE
ncbi:MAG TPA: Gfo/Idh/MocA family oxidoreductase [Paraburkholderia sp.]